MTEKQKLFSNYLVFYAPCDKIISAMVTCYCPSDLFEYNKQCNCHEFSDCEQCWFTALKTRKEKTSSLTKRYG